VLGYLLALPATLIGILLAVPYGARRPRWSDGCLELEARRMIGRPRGQTWGWLIYYRDRAAREDGRLRAHERVHVVQGFVGGPLFLVAYAVAFGVLWLRRGGGWRAAYRASPFERWARDREGRSGGWGRP
jgi:hypothetical protein